MIMVIMVLMAVIVAMLLCMLMLMFVRDMDIKLNSLNRRFFSAPHMEVKIVKPKLLQLMLQFVKVDTQINQCAYQHVPTDSAESIEIKRFHDLSVSALIWLAA